MQRRKSVFNNEMEQRFSLRKYTIGLCSVCLGFVTIGMGSQSVKADTVNNVEKSSVVREDKMQDADSATTKPNITPTETKKNEIGSVATTAPKTNTTSNGVKANTADSATSTEIKPQETKLAKTADTNNTAVVNTSDQSKSEDSSAVAPTSEKTQLQTSQDSSIKAKENSLNNKSNAMKAVAKFINLNEKSNSSDPNSKDAEVKPKESSNLDTNEQKEKDVDVAKPTRETVGSQWRIHYIDSTNHEHELKAPTVINMQYVRTNTPQSDGTIQHGDWSYVSGSFKQTGTQITVNDSDNPVKEDNVDKDGKNEDVFIIDAMYPSITGYNFHDGINNARLHDYLLNYDPNGNIQMPTMGRDFYVEYDPISERSVAVKFVDDQSYDFNTSDHKKQVGQAITLTGHDGDTVNLKLTVPDKYKLADGQQLPTTYTFVKGSGDLKIHLVHKVVQREAAIDVHLLLTTSVHTRDNDYAVGTITQARWKQLEEQFGDEIKHGPGGPDGMLAVDPSVKVGTLTGHVDYDLVDERVTSLGDDWTTLNLGGKTYQLPNGDEVVNGIMVDGDTTWGKSLKEFILKLAQRLAQIAHADLDPDYVNRPWHGYLSVNATNNDSNGFIDEVHSMGLQAGLVGDEPNALAKATGDRAATAVEMINKPIDLDLLRDYDFDFSEQDGQLQATLPVPVAGVYIPYVEKTATRTINVTMPDGKTTAVKQTATLAKQVDFGKDDHRDWTTGEWANYDVPTIPGYTASQSQIAKTAVTGTTEDQTVNITYTANNGTQTIIYQDGDNSEIGKQVISGKTDEKVKVTSDVPDGYVLKGEVPSEVTIKPDDTPITVTVEHGKSHIDPDKPVNSGEHIPGTTDKTYPSGLTHDDLNKTVTREVTITDPTGKKSTTTQTVTFTRGATVDEVTNKVTYDDWSENGKHTFDKVDVPTVPGYTASGEVPSIVVTPETQSSKVDITYTANSQTIHINYVDDENAGKIIHATTVTGKTGETVNLNLTVPDKYQLANSQQLPTTYTFAAGSGDVTIRLAHKVVQREATVDVQIGFMTLVDVDDEDEPGIVVTQNQWLQLDDEIKKHALVNDLEKVIPTVGVVGTLTGHVNYDLVDNKVVSFGNDWTSLNLGGQTYQMPDGTDVVNGIIVGTDLSWGEKLKEHFLNYTDDPDYATRPWHGYLSVNKSNIDPDYAGFRLVGNEPNALAKATGDRAATAIEMTNKPIDLSSLQDVMGGGLSDFNEQDGQLRAKAILPVEGMYIPYVEKTATRTINITTPDGKTTSVKQTTTLAKRVTAQENAHPDWTTSEWTSYDVPVIPGYTASQSNVAKEAVTGTTKDQTVNITYTANDGTQTIIYQGEDDSEIGKQVIHGKTDETVKVTPDVPDGYVVKGEVPSEVTIKPDDTPITITIEHGKSHIDPDKPVNSGEHIPGTTDKTYPSGLTHDDLNKTVTREVTITDPTGKKSTTTQTVTFTRGATVDEVTNKVTYDDWSENGKHTFDKVDVPTVPGYTASGEVPSIVVTPETQSSKVDITYSANAQTAMITYIDDTEKKTLGSDKQNGKFNQVITFEHDPAEVIKGLEEKGYKLVSNDFNSNKYQADNSNNVFYVHLKHGTSESSRKDDVNMTVHYVMDDGSKAPSDSKQTVSFTESGIKDNVTGNITWMPADSQTFKDVVTPVITGYKPDQDKVDGQTVKFGDSDINVTVHYSANAQTAMITYIDDTEKKTLGSDKQNGKFNQVITFEHDPAEVIKGLEEKGYKLVSNDFNSNKYQADNSNNVFYVHLKHGTSESSRKDDVNMTVHYVMDDGSKAPSDSKQTVSFTESGIKDNVTGNITWMPVASQTLKDVDSPVLTGYTADIKTANGKVVNFGDPDINVTVHYSANAQTATITYIDDTEKKTLGSDKQNGKFNQVITFEHDPAEVIKGLEEKGYKLVSDNFKSGVKYQNDNKSNSFEVHLVHSYEPVETSQTITETVHYIDANGKPVAPDHVATVVVKVTGTRDKVTDSITWNTPSTGHFDKVISPKLPNMIPDKKLIPGRDVQYGDSDITESVVYTPDEIPSEPEEPNKPDNSTSKTPEKPNKPSNLVSKTSEKPNKPSNLASKTSEKSNKSSKEISKQFGTIAKTTIPEKLIDSRTVDNHVSAKSTAKQELPQTGATTNTGIWTGLVSMIAGLGLVGASKKRKKN